MPDEVLHDLRRAVDAAASTFDGRGSAIKERELEMALETVLWALGREPRRQLRILLRDAWNGQVGGVDLALCSDSAPILIELKWDAGTLAACAWDSMKLAAALQSTEGKRAFLIAGSPVSDGLRGDELLEDGDVNPMDLRRRYAKEFDFWKGDVQKPSSLGTRRLADPTPSLHGPSLQRCAMADSPRGAGADRSRTHPRASSALRLRWLGHQQ